MALPQPSLCLLLLVGVLPSPSSAVLLSSDRGHNAHSLSTIHEDGDTAFLKFPDNFTFGAATAAFQVEGAAHEGGRTPSVYDHEYPGPTSGNVADDQYHRYKDDVALMAKLGLKAYRFSISWSRLLPNGKGPVNQEGARYYSNLIDELLKHNIDPFVTIFHWDTPQALWDEYRGWLGPKTKIVPDFANFARTVFDLYGDRVKHWITLNEPWCVAKSHILPPQADWLRVDPLDAPYVVAHNLLLSHAEAVHIYRTEFQSKQHGQIGITLNLDWAEPISKNPQDVAAAERTNTFMLGWFADPIFYGDYPAEMKTRHLGLMPLPRFTAEESSRLLGSADFLGINNYFAKFARRLRPFEIPNIGGIMMGPELGVSLETDPFWQYDDGDRPVTPWGFQKLLQWVSKRYKPSGGIYVTENGVPAEPASTLRVDQAREPNPRPYQALAPPAEDWDHETYEDPTRVRYLKAHLEALHAAIEEGADVRGYFVWSLLDNFEWGNYHTRFGIVHVDYDTQKRTPKRSARVYAEVIKQHGLAPLPQAERFPGLMDVSQRVPYLKH